MFDKFHDECGVVAIYAHPEAEKLAYLGLHGVTERHHAANDRPGHPLAFVRKPFQRFAVSGNFAGRFAAGDGPSVRRAHHHALEHGLAADQGFLAAFKRGQQLHGHQETPPGSQETHKL